MRAWLSIPCFLLAATAVWPAAAEEFPYTAYVNGDDVYLRSGPGQNYYPTSKLKVGEAVEVYRHDPGGWYAIRPPEGSFSWVSTRYLKLGRDKIATVNGDRVVARVGSSFSDIRDVIQVRLERGEEVEVLETKTLDAAHGGEKWAKVAPVAGEFRWVLGKFLDRTPPEPKLLADQPSRNVLAAKQGEHSEENRVQDDDPVSHEADVAPSRSAFRPVRSSSDAKSTRPASFSQASHDEPGKLPPAEKEQPLASTRPRTAGNTVNEEGFQAEIDQMDMEISQMVSEEPTVWDFSDLRTRAETAVARAQTALERGRARLVLSKIQRFQEIQGRYQQVASVKTESTVREAELTAAIVEKPDVQQSAAVAAAQQPATARFDGAGRLTAVISLRIGTPHFALVDPGGAVRSYVTPAPGVNLRPYLGRQVGISGARGFMPELGTPHVTARQITLLEQPLMR
jgi:SH3-like domain-containing protein